ncbi:MAG: hypothetical protein LC640_05675 [Frankia sp.]|nr:hypothetical protein [Frankia sp.]
MASVRTTTAGVIAALFASTAAAAVLSGYSVGTAPRLPPPKMPRPEVPVDERPIAIVPFRRVLAPEPPVSAPAVDAGAPVGRRCRFADLEGEVFKTSPSTPTRGVSLVLWVRNRSTRACDLDPAYPSGQVIAEHGRVLVWGNHGADVILYRPPPPLAPGGEATTSLWWPSWCGRTPPGHWRLRLKMPGVDADVRVVPPLPAPACDHAHRRSANVLVLGPWQLLDAAGRPLSRPPQWGLRLRVRAPAEARAGGLLQLDMIVENPTRAAISLVPCPTYGFLLSPFEHGFQLVGAEVLTLNCAAAPRTLPSGKSVLFRGELRLDGRLKIDRPPAPGRWQVGATLSQSRNAEVVVPITLR